MFLFDNIADAKPFLKWAGGKTQLIPAIKSALPKELYRRDSITYIEPFIGSGAVLFWFLGQFPNVKKAVINDINPDLTKAYTIIRDKPHELIKTLSMIQDEYYALVDEEAQREYFSMQRNVFNGRDLDDIKNTSLLIFLNRTCFNGLYRVNSKNKFNVPFGRYINPKICDEKTILSDSRLLQKVTILNGDFSKTLDYADEKSFFYFDPPYKPLSQTSSFNSYASECFNDASQERLAAFCREIDSLNHLWLLSNSDPKNVDKADNFFEKLYSGFAMARVKAKRNINSNSSKRGEINELLITNYQHVEMQEVV